MYGVFQRRAKSRVFKRPGARAAWMFRGFTADAVCGRGILSRLPDGLQFQGVQPSLAGAFIM
jgi:hypothetical protein